MFVAREALTMSDSKHIRTEKRRKNWTEHSWFDIIGELAAAGIRLLVRALRHLFD
ncbi:hypothetical protein [Paenibacillus xylaniclasticus]|uniref:hypothetical protein n=1 Tax=Paenibacillus xylaniclasticus TaxID=588083 RepID=UPI0013DE83E1|nr:MULTISPECIES: hypothetical protein [Paenibacillus]GFN33957.1 hypothetical protein PCURB6_42170 [Paenibacillus curdlanolyticus]